MTRPYRKFTELLDDALRNPQDAADFLTQVLAEEDIGVFLISLKDIIRVHGNLALIAQKAKISRGTLYNMFSKQANPELKTVLAVLDSLGYDLKVTPQQSRVKTSKARARRPKVGPGRRSVPRKHSRHLGVHRAPRRSLRK